MQQDPWGGLVVVFMGNLPIQLVETYRPSKSHPPLMKFWIEDANGETDKSLFLNKTRKSPSCKMLETPLWEDFFLSSKVFPGMWICDSQVIIVGGFN